ncbi:uncharacterized protein LOC111606182 isoform X1 [Xiphophorus maculatus]|uniref:uncharacterized protein LOC111606182 isoform X1 n=2 Tax=Xiphophorus maculatus TaxID=8083 RepID=UPI000C6CF230|nr:uncharacterized protein LOC111606182 isoform X1 [Xiphophorus maculatus]
MVNHNPPRIILMFVGLFTLFPAITLNFLSGFGDYSGVFRQRTEDVSLKYMTSVTPAQWTFFVWDFIYFWFFAMFVYLLAGLCRRSTYEWMYTTPAVLPYGFHVSIIIYLSLNITWLFLYDREMLLPVLITAALMTLTDYMTLFFSCHGLKIYGAWLSKHRNADLWMFRILVQNGVAVYATWGTLSTLLNLTIYLQHQTEASRYHCTMLSLLLLLMELLVWFLLENFYLDKHLRYTVTIYPLVILWLTGILDNNASPGTNLYILEVLILVIACVLLVVRIILVAWRHHKQPLYTDNELSLTPVEISLSQPNLFL